MAFCSTPILDPKETHENLNLLAHMHLDDLLQRMTGASWFQCTSAIPQNSEIIAMISSCDMSTSLIRLMPGWVIWVGIMGVVLVRFASWVLVAYVPGDGTLTSSLFGWRLTRFPALRTGLGRVLVSTRYDSKAFYEMRYTMQSIEWAHCLRRTFSTFFVWLTILICSFSSLVGSFDIEQVKRSISAKLFLPKYFVWSTNVVSFCVPEYHDRPTS